VVCGLIVIKLVFSCMIGNKRIITIMILNNRIIIIMIIINRHPRRYVQLCLACIVSNKGTIRTTIIIIIVIIIIIIITIKRI
jgi:hypothetical protein